MESSEYLPLTGENDDGTNHWGLGVCRRTNVGSRPRMFMQIYIFMKMIENVESR